MKYTLDSQRRTFANWGTSHFSTRASLNVIMYKILISIFLAAISCSAMAEVSDKIVSVPGMWFQGLFFSGVAFLLASKKWWLSVVGVAFSMFLVSAVYDMQADENLKRSIILEQGNNYFLHGYSAYGLVAIGSISGLWLRFRLRTSRLT